MMDRIFQLEVSARDQEARFSQFVRTMDWFGLEYHRKFYGIYRAIVITNKDPEERGRIKIMCPDAGHRSDVYPPVWVNPDLHMVGKGRGHFQAPSDGDIVNIKFALGDPSKPVIYMGGYVGKSEKAEEFKYSNGRPERQGWITRMGHRMIVSDEAGKESVLLAWHKADPSDEALKKPSVTADRKIGKTSTLELANDSSIQLISADGTKFGLGVNLNANGKTQIVLKDINGNSIIMSENKIVITNGSLNTITLDGHGVEIQHANTLNVKGQTTNLDTSAVKLGSGASYSVPLGELLMLLFNSHTHVCAVGPSSPPTIPMTSAALSSSVTVSGPPGPPGFSGGGGGASGGGGSGTDF